MDATSKRKSTDRLFQDLVTAARLTEVPYDEATLRRILTVYAEGFLNRSVQIRSTTKSRERRDLCFRYLDLDGGPHPLHLAEAAGDLCDDGHPISGWLHRVHERIPALGYGIDFEACHGLSKIWQFLGVAVEPRAFLELPHMPRAFRASLPLLRELQLDAVTIVGVDYVQRSVNLYFRPSHPTHATPALLGRACERLSYLAPSEAAGAHAARTGCIAFTYGWDSPEIERICFYVAGFSRDEVPDHHPLLRRFAAEAPAVVDDPRFIVGWSHGRRDTYLKIEDDYTGDVTGVFLRANHVPHVGPARRPPTELRSAV
jgi:hypothetical protein